MLNGFLPRIYLKFKYRTTFIFATIGFIVMAMDFCYLIVVYGVYTKNGYPHFSLFNIDSHACITVFCTPNFKQIVLNIHTLRQRVTIQIEYLIMVYDARNPLPLKPSYLEECRIYFF